MARHELRDLILRNDYLIYKPDIITDRLTFNNILDEIQTRNNILIKTTDRNNAKQPYFNLSNEPTSRCAI